MNKTLPEEEGVSAPKPSTDVDEPVAEIPFAAVPVHVRHSMAFENLVRGSDDVVGLLAYAKFKQSVHEAAVAGNHMDRAARQVTPAMVGVLRSASEQIITQIVEEGLQAAAPDIENSALRTSMEAKFAETVALVRTERGAITTHIDRRTSLRIAFFTNLAAWAVTLIVAIAIIRLFNGPSLEESILGVEKTPQVVQGNNAK